MLTWFFAYIAVLCCKYYTSYIGQVSHDEDHNNISIVVDIPGKGKGVYVVAARDIQVKDCEIKVDVH